MEDLDFTALAAVQHARPRQELRALGCTDADLRRLVRRGVLTHAFGHYIDARLGDHARLACALAARPGAVLSHFTAAKLTDIPTWTNHTTNPNAIWLTRDRARGRAAIGPRLVVKQATLSAQDVSPRQVGSHGLTLPMTTVARTVVDLARELPLREAVVSVDHALRRAVTRGALEEVLARQERWPGVAAARAAVAFGDPRAESPLESIARAVFAEAGLPAPVLQAQFWDGCGWTCERVDFWWPEYRTWAEADGLAKYEAATSAERRRLHRLAFRREQRLAAVTGAELVRFGWEDAVVTPAQLVARMAAAFDRGVSRAGASPIWRAPDPTDDRLWPITDDATPLFLPSE